MSDMAVSAHNGDDHENERPAKKRRFFVEDENGTSHLNVSQQDTSSQADSPLNDQDSDMISENPIERTAAQQPVQDANGFDAQLFASIVGQDVPETTITMIQQAAGGNMERAINIFLDGSYERITTRPTTTSIPARPQRTLPAPETQTETGSQVVTTPPNQSNLSEWTPPEGAEVLKHMSSRRYIGAFGVAAWATKSGLNVIRHEDKVKIERTKIRTTKMGKKGRIIPNQKADVITRFTNMRGEEIGRLPQDTAEWVSTLIDQKICDFEGSC
ncbi:hypothetical protein F66182_12797, partial [Fusarium sp. NRRL 66182]